MEKYEPINLIGKGNFGAIYKIRRVTDNKILVWKELDYGRMDEKEKHHIVSEVNILRELHHPNIVKYVDRIIDKKTTKIYIIMEYCPRGDLSQLIKRCKRSKEYINEEVIWKIFTQILLALYACHNHKNGKILHRDIKPSNVFIDNDNNVKLGDFGLSRMLSNESNFAYSNVGTPYYMSPEQIDENRYNEKSDIWSLGCCLYELTSLRPPFEATNHLSLALKIKAGKVARIPPRYSDELNRVIMWMMTVDMNRRPSVDDLVNIPQVAIRIKERKVKEGYQRMKMMEESLREREEKIKEKEKELELREKYLDEREKVIKEKEEVINNEMTIRQYKRNTDNNKYNEYMRYSNHLNTNNVYSSNTMRNSNYNTSTNTNSIEIEQFKRNLISKNIDPTLYSENTSNEGNVDNGNDADNSEMGSIVFPPKPSVSVPLSSLKDVYHKPMNTSFNSNTIAQVSSQSSTMENNYQPHYISHTTTNSHNLYENNNSVEFTANTSRGKNTPRRRIPYGVSTPSLTKYSGYNNTIVNTANRSYAIPRNNSYNFTQNTLVNTSYKKKNSYRNTNASNRRINFDNFV